MQPGNAILNTNGTSDQISSSTESSSVKRMPNTNTPVAANFIRRQNSALGMELSLWRLFEITVAEIIGTGCLMFFVCMSVLGPVLSPLFIPIAVGLIIATIVQIFAHISSAHLNPSVTLCALLLGNIDIITALVYLVAEIIGALIGYGLLMLITPYTQWDTAASSGTFCATLPAYYINDVQSIMYEFSATAFLILTVCSVWDARNSTRLDSAPLKFGGVIAVMIMVIGPYTGGSMNPARSLAPAIWYMNFNKQWVYWVGPLLGSASATLAYKFIFLRKHSSGGAEEMPLT